MRFTYLITGAFFLSTLPFAAYAVVSPIVSDSNNFNVVEEPQVLVLADTTQKNAIEPVQEIIRQAINTTGYPVLPKVSVPAYPDPTKWYQYQDPVTVFWEIPDDVVKIAVEVDNEPNTEPSNAEEGLFTGKEIGVLDPGEHYIHVQFKNNIGWGPVAHYRISIDVEPPAPFAIEFDDSTQNGPAPIISIDYFDALSGVDQVLVSVDGEIIVEDASNTVVLPLQKPGIHTMMVRVLDRAKNVRETTASFEIDPIQTPVISFFAQSISQGEQGLISGNALPGIFVDVTVRNAFGETVFSDTARVDELGNWNLVFDEELSIGNYAFVAVARDHRGAISYPTEHELFRVAPKVIFSFGFIDLGWLELLVFVVLLGVSIFALSAWYYSKEQSMRSAYAAIAARDIKRFGDQVLRHIKDIEEVSAAQNKGRKSKGVTLLQEEIDRTSLDIRGVVKKMNRYLIDVVNKS